MKPISRRGLFKAGAALAVAPSLLHTLRGEQVRRPVRMPAPWSRPRERVNPARHLLLRGGTIVTMDPAVGDFATGDIHIQGKKIVAVGRESQSAGRRAGHRRRGTRSSFRDSSTVIGIRGRRSSGGSSPTA